MRASLRNVRRVTKETFITLSQTIFGEQALFLSDALFRVFDDDGSGTMDFQEYILALNATQYDPLIDTFLSDFLKVGYSKRQTQMDL